MLHSFCIYILTLLDLKILAVHLTGILQKLMNLSTNAEISVFLLPLSKQRCYAFKMKGEREEKETRRSGKERKRSLQIILFQVYFFFQKDISIFCFQIANIRPILIGCDDPPIHCWNL